VCVCVCVCVCATVRVCAHSLSKQTLDESLKTLFLFTFIVFYILASHDSVKLFVSKIKIIGIMFVGELFIGQHHICR
jgi:hypothetical protein